MKIQWEQTDIRRNRKVWRDAECFLASTDGQIYALVVADTKRIMVVGDAADVAHYMNEWGYRPTAEK